MNPEHDDLAHYRLSAEENERVFREEIVPLRLARFEPQDQPLLIVLMALRWGLNGLNSNVIDVGYAGVIGADLNVHGETP